MKLKERLLANNVKYIDLKFNVFDGAKRKEEVINVPEKVPFIKNTMFDDNQNELIFGLKRYIFKIKTYIGSQNEEEFFKNEMAFDASLYCLTTLSEIASQISKDEKICSYYQGIDFEDIAGIYKSAIHGDMFDMNAIASSLFEILPFFLLLMYLREGVVDF